MSVETIANTGNGPNCDGIVATNTTTSRPKSNSQSGACWFSNKKEAYGKPLANKSTDFIKKIYSLTDGKWPIIGVGGIMNSDDVEKITAGASLDSPVIVDLFLKEQV